MKLFLFLLLIISRSYANECDEGFIKRLNKDTTVILLCSPLSDDRELLSQCFTYAFGAFSISTGSFLAMKDIPKDGIIKTMQNLEKLDLNKGEQRFLRKALKEAREGKKQVKNMKKILDFMSKKPAVFRKSVDVLSRSILFARLSGFARWAMKLSALFLLTDIVTNLDQDQCRLLTGWSGISDEHKDTRFVRFESECTSMSLGNSFFSIQDNEQMEVLKRSPKLCQLAQRWLEDINSVINEFMHPLEARNCK
jgi:hypothetical protein